MSTSGVRCSRCGRHLKNPKAIEYGMGAVCRRKNEIEMLQKEAEKAILDEKRADLAAGKTDGWDLTRKPGESDNDFRGRILNKK